MNQNDPADLIQNEPTTSSGKPKRSYGTKTLITPDIAAALDRTKTTSRSGAHTFNTLAESEKFEESGSDLAISHSTIHRARKRLRLEVAAEIQQTFSPEVPLTLHWDGKIMADYENYDRHTVDRLPILVSGEDVTKLLAIPKLKTGDAETEANACMEVVTSWNIQDRIMALCFDTTSVNTGSRGGVCVRIETALKKIA